MRDRRRLIFYFTPTERVTRAIGLEDPFPTDAPARLTWAAQPSMPRWSATPINECPHCAVIESITGDRFDPICRFRKREITLFLRTFVHAAHGLRIFLVLEYVHGTSLSHLLKAASAKNATIPSAVASAIISGALHGLHAAHERNFDT